MVFLLPKNYKNCSNRMIFRWVSKFVWKKIGHSKKIFSKLLTQYAMFERKSEVMVLYWKLIRSLEKLVASKYKEVNKNTGICIEFQSIPAAPCTIFLFFVF